MKKAKKVNIRAIASQCLAKVICNNCSLNHCLADKQAQIADARDRAFLATLCFGVCRWYEKLLWCSDQYLNKPLKNKDTDILCLIMLGIYQLEVLDVPAHACISETVDSAKQLKKPWATKLINAVLRHYQREPNWNSPTIPNPHQWSHPKWLFNLIKKHWHNQWQSILTANNTEPFITLRLNLNYTTIDNYINLLKENNISSQQHEFCKTALILNQKTNITDLPGFNEGYITIQDAGAQLAGTLLKLAPEQSILDACAAPGGKTTQLLEVEPKLKKVTALEKSAARTERLIENIERLNQPSIEVHITAAENISGWWDKTLFDRILLDAPCSGTGVIRKHPDIKLLRQPADIEELHQQQLMLLHSLWPTLKTGGLLLYVTCSILPEENDKTIETFIKANQDAQLDQIDAAWGLTTQYGRQLLPSLSTQTAGFYFARLLKQGTI